MSEEKREVWSPIPQYERHYSPYDDDNYNGHGDLVGLQQSWPLAYDWAWCGEHEPIGS